VSTESEQQIERATGVAVSARRPLRILCVNYEYPPIGGGGGRVAEDLNHALVDRGHEVHVVTLGMPDLPSFEDHGRLVVHRVRAWRRHRHYTTFAEMLTLLRPLYKKAHELATTHQYDINHTHFIVPSGVVSWRLHRETGLPYVLTVHGSDVPGYNPDRFHLPHLLIRPFWRRILNASAGVTSPSNYVSDLLHKHANTPVEVIANGYDCPEVPSDVPKQNRIIVVTRMFQRKGVQFFLRALKGLDTDWEVCIAGDGPYLPKLREEARRVAPHVKFLGFVQGKVLTDLYASAKIFVFPSIAENFPVVLLEAMNAGCAVITSDAPGCMEVVSGAGIVTPVGQAAPIRDALARLIADPEEIARLRMLGHKRVAQVATPLIAKQFEDFYNHVLAPRA